MVRSDIPLRDSHFSLDASGVAGFFGGDEAIAAMLTVHLYEGRRWLGWYNSPGSYTVAKRYGQIANSRFWDGLFPGPNQDPSIAFELEGMTGPKFIAARSGTTIQHTGHLGYLFAEECKGRKAAVVKGRKTSPMGVTIVELHGLTDSQPSTQTNDHSVDLRLRTHSIEMAAFPISISLGACIACGIFRDWFCFSMILLGIVSSGVTCLVIGSGKFDVRRIVPAKGSPKGDGMMISDKDVIILQGEESSVATITRGSFTLDFTGQNHPDAIQAGGEEHEPVYRSIGLCSLLLVAQFLLQLLLIPQGTLFGQIMFIVSLAVSWAYNSYLASIEKEKVQREILMQKVLKEPWVKKYQLGTRTSMTVFVLLAMAPAEPRKLLNEMLPNDTRAWKTWKDTVLDKIEKNQELRFSENNWNLAGFRDDETSLLKTLYGDAEDAYEGHLGHRASRSDDIEKGV